MGSIACGHDDAIGGHQTVELDGKFNERWVMQRLHGGETEDDYRHMVRRVRQFHGVHDTHGGFAAILVGLRAACDRGHLTGVSTGHSTGTVIPLCVVTCWLPT